MGALARKIKESNMYQMFESVQKLILDMVNSEYEPDDQTVEQAIADVKKENPEMDLNDIEKDINEGTKALEEQAKELFGKDEDGYNKIPNKLENIKADVQKIEIEEDKTVERAKGGRERTRVDED